MGGEPSQRPAGVFAQLGPDLRGGQSQVLDFRELIQLNSPKEKTPSFLLFFHFTWIKYFLAQMSQIETHDSGFWLPWDIHTDSWYRFWYLSVHSLCCPMHNAQVGPTQTALSCTCSFNLFELIYKIVISIIISCKGCPRSSFTSLNLALLVHKEMWEDTGSLKWSWCLGHFP